jgi:hypothetical protein
LAIGTAFAHLADDPDGNLSSEEWPLLADETDVKEA